MLSKGFVCLGILMELFTVFSKSLTCEEMVYVDSYHCSRSFSEDVCFFACYFLVYREKFALADGKEEGY